MDEVVEESVKYLALAGSSSDVKRLLAWLHELYPAKEADACLTKAIESAVLSAKRYPISIYSMSELANVVQAPGL